MTAKKDFRVDLTTAGGRRPCRELGMSEARLRGTAHAEKLFSRHLERRSKSGLFTERDLDSVSV
ncbi:MAG: hypothetical protein LBQ79_07220 [Deltaproteobacteria bacterium]|jgi:hypothetical protein|nr:hypothetical protein [Deltaproteobacteria bacterium]